MSLVAKRRATSLARESGAEAILQMTGWFRPTVSGALNASYHDGNLASYLLHPDLRIDRESWRVRRALEWERDLYDRTDLILTMSSWLRQFFLEYFGQPEEKVVVVGGGSNLADRVEVVEREWSPPRFLFVGREWHRKGGPELLHAWPMVRSAAPEAELMIVGPREVPEPLPDGVVAYGHFDRGSPGEERAYVDIFKRATAFVMPSLYEPFGIALLEAMAFGLPCVAADRCAMPEIVEDGVTGRVVNPADPEALAQALLELAGPATAARMGGAGRSRMQVHFTWDAVAGRILDAIGARIPANSGTPSG